MTWQSGSLILLRIGALGLLVVLRGLEPDAFWLYGLAIIMGAGVGVIEGGKVRVSSEDRDHVSLRALRIGAAIFLTFKNLLVAAVVYALISLTGGEAEDAVTFTTMIFLFIQSVDLLKLIFMKVETPLEPS